MVTHASLLAAVCIAPLLAGCLSEPAGILPHECTELPVAMPRLGSAAEYELAHGNFSAFSGTTRIELQKGTEKHSRLAMAVSDSVTRMLDTEGRWRDAIQVTYWQTGPPTVPIYDEWIDAQNGMALASWLRMQANATQVYPTGAIAWYGAGQPPLVGLTMVPSNPISATANRTFSAPWLWFDEASRHPISLPWKSEARTYETFARRVEIHGNSMPIPGQYADRICSMLVYGEGEPMIAGLSMWRWGPLDWPYEENWLGELTRIHNSTLEPIPSYEPLPISQPNTITRDEFFQDNESLDFATSYAEAQEAAQRNAKVQAWLKVNKHAPLSAVLHTVHPLNSPNADRWEFYWQTSLTLDSLHVQVDAPKHENVASIEVPMTVTSHEGHDHSRLRGTNELARTSIAAMGQAFRDLSGVAPDTLACDFWENYCFLGNRELLDWPYANEWPNWIRDTWADPHASWAKQGLLFHVTEGRALQFSVPDLTTKIPPVSIPEEWR